ncbi:DUF6020 family protein [Desulfofustis limnaeus]|uniref:DUF6020 family protein n=1 Tax=Desulfofustis limnaeus TaxID=2740163 RepID=UPI0024E00C7F|nr:DUF6020 family protein [Desulfofustis limnaeus]
MILINLGLRQETTLILDIETDTEETLQLFWKNKHQDFDQNRSIRVRLYPDKKNYQFSLPGFASYDTLRIDPIDRKSSVIIRSLEFQISGRTGVELQAEEAFREFLELRSGAALAPPPAGSGALVTALGNDPQLILDTKTWSLVMTGYGRRLLAAVTLAVTAVYLLAWARRRFISHDETWSDKKQRLCLAGCGLASGYLVLVLPVALPEHQKVSSWLGVSIAGAICLFILVAYLATRKRSSLSYTAHVGRFAWLQYALPSLLIFSLYLLAFWPASMSPDSLDQWKQVLKFNFKDWHPVFHTLNLWVFAKLWPSPVTAALFQILLLACSFGWAMARLQRMGASRLILWCTCLLFALLPLNGLMSVTIWKDIPYSVSMMILSIFLLEMAISSGKWLESKKNMVLLTIVVVLVSLYRHNGIFPAFGTLPVCLLIFPTRWQRLLVVLVAALSLHIFVRGPVYTWLDVERNNPLSHISAKIEKKLENFFKRKLLADAEDQEMASARGTSQRTQHPDVLEMIGHSIAVRLDSSSLLWRVLPLEGYYKRIDYVNLWEVSKEEERKIRYISGNNLDLRESPKLPVLTTLLFDLFERTKDHLFLFSMWRPAFYLYLLMFAAIVAGLRMKKAVPLILVPLLFNSVPVLFFVSKSSIFRYHYSITLTALALTLTLLFSPLSNRAMMRRSDEIDYTDSML